MNQVLYKLVNFHFSLTIFFLINFSWSRNINELIFEKRNIVNKNIIVEYVPNDQLNNLNYTLFSENIQIKYLDDNKINELEEKLENNVDISALVPSVNFNFYNQLNDIEKTIYNTVYSSSSKEVPDLKINVKISEIEDIEYFFNEELSELSLRTFTALAYENPELWWINSCNFGAANIDESTVIVTYLMNDKSSPFSDMSAEQISKLNKEIDQVKNKIMDQISKTGLTTPYAILRFIHDYLVTKIVYTNNQGKHIRSLYGALVEEKCVCEGYAEAFQYLARQYNINCIIARSSKHEWNFVEMKGKWYIVDVTYDDPVIGKTNTPAGSNDNLQLYYFLTGTEHESKYVTKYSEDIDHKLVYSAYNNTIYSNLVSYPTLEKTDYQPTNEELNELKLIDNTFPDTITDDKSSNTSDTSTDAGTVQEIEDPNYKSDNTSDGKTIKKYGSIIVTNFIVVIIMKIVFF